MFDPTIGAWRPSLNGPKPARILLKSITSKFFIKPYNCVLPPNDVKKIYLTIYFSRNIAVNKAFHGGGELQGFTYNVATLHPIHHSVLLLSGNKKNILDSVCSTEAHFSYVYAT